MLIEEILREASDIELRQAIDDIILRARKNNVSEIDIDDIAAELGQSFDALYVKPNDEEFKQKITSILGQNNWISGVNPTGIVLIKKPGEINKITGEPGDEMQKRREAQRQKIQRSAMNRVKKKDGM